MEQVDDLARIGTLSYDSEKDDGKWPSDQLYGWKAATSWSTRRLKVEGSVTCRRCQVKRLADHVGVDM